MLENIIRTGLSFDDVLLIPAKSDVLPDAVDINTQLTKNIRINSPFISAAMNTVTEAKLAIAIAREGGVGVIHRALPIEAQAAQVVEVKRSEGIIITFPVCMDPAGTVGDALELMKKYGISGILVAYDGWPTPLLSGIVTNRDLKFETNLTLPIRDIMTERENLIVGNKKTTTEEAKALMKKHRIEKLPIIDENGIVIGLITAKDIEKKGKFPNACKDTRGRLLVGAAVGVSPETLARVRALVDAGVDFITVDTAHGHSARVINIVAEIRTAHPNLEIIAGNVATADATKDLIEAGASAIKVGVGPGSICSTRIVSGAGVPQITAISDCAKAAEIYGIPVIADGGIKFSGDVTKAIAAGAHCVMIGSLFAGTDESPGELIRSGGQQFKTYNGMGSLIELEASASNKDRYAQEDTENKKLVPEGVEGRVPYKGLLAENLNQLSGGLRAGMGYCGCRNIEELRKNSRFIQITAAGLRESHVHDVTITKESPNYRLS